GNTFLDVDSDDWFAPYVAAAHGAGLIDGSDGMFRPNDTITREEICKIIACATDSYAEAQKLEFTDSDEISDWAKEYVSKVYSLGIVNGMDDGSFLPKNNALREQAFVILARFTKLFNKESV
ncbi:MAG: S-layer homology domain-containing protein, partial [Clostridia bacterium]|nr:S-layer homology domain-containing protein [Clostridia bacterium]